MSMLWSSWPPRLLERKKKQQQSRVFFFFLRNFNVYADVDNRERARVTNKQVLLETQHENFKEVVRNVSRDFKIQRRDGDENFT